MRMSLSLALSLACSALIQLRYLTFLQLQGNLRNIWVLEWRTHTHAHTHARTRTLARHLQRQVKLALIALLKRNPDTNRSAINDSPDRGSRKLIYDINLRDSARMALPNWVVVEGPQRVWEGLRGTITGLLRCSVCARRCEQLIRH